MLFNFLIHFMLITLMATPNVVFRSVHVGHGPAQVGSAKDDLKAGWAKIKKTSLWQPSE